MTTGDVHPLLRLTRQGRSALLQAGKVIVPTISDSDTILPARVAPSSAISEKPPFWTRGKVEKIKGTAAVYAHDGADERVVSNLEPHCRVRPVDGEAGPDSVHIECVF